MCFFKKYREKKRREKIQREVEERRRLNENLKDEINSVEKDVKVVDLTENEKHCSNCVSDVSQQEKHEQKEVTNTQEVSQQEKHEQKEVTNTQDVLQEEKPLYEEVEDDDVYEEGSLDKKEEPKNIYHVSQEKNPKSDNFKRWRIRKEGSSKTIKFYETQKEALEVANELAKNNNGSVKLHRLNGKIRKQ